MRKSLTKFQAKRVTIHISIYYSHIWQSEIKYQRISNIKLLNWAFKAEKTLQIQNVGVTKNLTPNNAIKYFLKILHFGVKMTKKPVISYNFIIIN